MRAGQSKSDIRCIAVAVRRSDRASVHDIDFSQLYPSLKRLPTDTLKTCYLQVCYVSHQLSVLICVYAAQVPPLLAHALPLCASVLFG